MNFPIEYVVGAVVVVILLVIFAMGYVPGTPNRAKIISGLSKKPRIAIGKASFRVPFIEKVDWVYLGQIGVDIKTTVPIPTADFINVNVDAVSKIQVDPSAEGIACASKNFLNMPPTKIAQELKDSFEGYSVIHFTTDPDEITYSIKDARNFADTLFMTMQADGKSLVKTTIQ